MVVVAVDPARDADSASIAADPTVQRRLYSDRLVWRRQAARVMDRRLLTRVKLRNYKSIAACDVAPAQLSFLVGPNGSGKSNFLDALRFIADSLRFSIDHALRDRGGINEVRRRSGGHPTHFGIRVEFNLEASQGHYSSGWEPKRVADTRCSGKNAMCFNEDRCFNEVATNSTTTTTWNAGGS